MAKFFLGPRKQMRNIFGNMSKKEASLQLFLIAVLTAFYAVELFVGCSTQFNLIQKLLALWLFFDVGGGIISCWSHPVKDWHHAPHQGKHHHVGFLSIHIVHLAIVAFAFQANLVWQNINYLWIAGSYLALLIPTLVVSYTKIPLKRTFLIIYVMALFKWAPLLPAQYSVLWTPELSWFMYFFSLKYIAGYLVGDTNEFLQSWGDTPVWPADDAR